GAVDMQVPLAERLERGQGRVTAVFLRSDCRGRPENGVPLFGGQTAQLDGRPDFLRSGSGCRHCVYSSGRARVPISPFSAGFSGFLESVLDLPFLDHTVIEGVQGRVLRPERPLHVSGATNVPEEGPDLTTAVPDHHRPAPAPPDPVAVLRLAEY